MKIFFIITSSDRFAKGGHFRSCLTIAQALYPNMSIEIINIGTIKSNVFNETDIPVHFFKINYLTFLFDFLKICFFFACNRQSKIIAFDYYSTFIARNTAALLTIPFAYFKCGGPNYEFVPYSLTVFCFSRENHDYFKSKKILKHSTTYLIPNRVAKNKRELKSLSHILKNNAPIILRIGRFVDNYNNVNESILNMSNLLTENNIKHNIVFIGYPDDKNSNLFTKLKIRIEERDNILLLDTPEYTKQAFDYSKEAKLIIGTGRGVMEAFVGNIPTAVYSSQYQIPVIIDNDNLLNNAFDQNFSPRVNFDDLSEEEVSEKLLSFFESDEYYNQVKIYQSLQNKSFDIEYAIPQYIDAINNMKTGRKFHVVNYLCHLKLFILKTFSLTFN